jgi:methionyl-tRNA formyltransferase
MRLIFAGTPEFAERALRALVVAGHAVVLVLTQPDRPAGRGMKLKPSDVKVAAEALGLPLAQPATLRNDEALSLLRSYDAEAMIVAAYGLILPQSVLDSFPRGCINIHASLLPRWRGAAPIQRALLAGDTRTGISIMQMDAGLDTGAVLSEQAIEIAADDTAATLHDKLADLGARSIVDCLALVGRGAITPILQPEVGVTYAAKIDKREAIIDWSQSAQQIDRQVRAFNPFPVASTTLAGEAVKIWRARLAAGAGSPGEVLDVSTEGITVACGEAALQLLELQRASSRRMPAAEFVRGNGIAPATRFGA